MIFNRKLKTMNKELVLENETLKKEMDKFQEKMEYNSNNISDDFNVINQVLELKTKYYEDTIFVFNRYKEFDKKVNVSTNEINEATKDIVYYTFLTLSENYKQYIVDKYFASYESMIDLYVQRTYLRLFTYANKYNVEKGRDNFLNENK